MSQVKIFDIKNLKELRGCSPFIDRLTKDKIKKHADLFLNLKLIAEDYIIDGGDIIDGIAVDSNNNPIILLFQEEERDNIIGQGIYYLEWLVRHKYVFSENLAKSGLSISAANINWGNVGILCVGHDFSKYDKCVAAHIDQNIELINCCKYGSELLTFITVYEPEGRRSKKENLVLAMGEEDEHNKLKRFIKVFDTPRIGYCEIENNRHYVVFPNKQRNEIYEIPTPIYIAQSQFVLVDEYSCFKYVFPYWVGDNEIITSNISSFAVVTINDSGIFINKGDNEYLPLNNIPSNIKLRDKNIVSIDNDNNFIRFYRQAKHNADSFMFSAKIKEHIFVFVLKVLPGGVLLREIETGKEFFKSMDTDKINFKEQQILCLKNGSIVHSIASGRFYTLSSFYDRFEYGVVEIKEGLTFLKKLSGEKVIINDAPPYLRVGQVAYVDEYNNFCGVEDDGLELGDDAVKRNITNIQTFKRQDKKERIEVTKQILVLGNKAYENSYKLCLLKFGYRAEVLEGFEPWAKISTELKETDIVVVVTSHVSHDNMWRAKKEIEDIPVIYSEFDGANRILEQVLAIEQGQDGDNSAS